MIDAWLEADQQSSVRQRHTARRVWQRLGAEHGAGLAEITVSRHVRAWRAEHRPAVEGMVAQEHLPGQEAEVDFGEFVARIDGVETCCHLFVLRLSALGKAVHVAFTNQGREAFLEGHVRAFTALGGVPAQIRARHLPGRQYDIATEFATERRALQPGRRESFETGVMFRAGVDRRARVRVRSAVRNSVTLRSDHYLEVLSR